MAIVHEYVPSSEKSGLYLRDGYDGAVVTYQVSATAQDVLRALGYEDGDRLQREVFDVLHRLGLIYTHNSGVTPPESLLDLELDDSEVQSLTDADRETMLSTLLDRTDLDDDEREELRTYARDKGVDPAALDGNGTGDSEGESTESADDGDDPSDADGDPEDESDDRRPERPEEDVPHVRCEYCDEVPEATEYVDHVRASGGPHGDPGTCPDDFVPGNATLTDPGRTDVAYPDDFEADCRYYPVCRWCGTRFLRLGAHDAHLKRKNRDGFDADLHARNPNRYGRPLLLPFSGDSAVIHPDRLAESITADARSALTFADGLSRRSPAPGSHQRWQRQAGREEASEIETSQPTTAEESADRTAFSERVPEYERLWLLTDLSRLVDLLSRAYEESSEVRATLAAMHGDLLDLLWEATDVTKPLPGSLREYKRHWDEPEIGVRVPADVLDARDVDDYRDDLYVPPGYPIPVRSVDRRLTEAWIAQEWPNAAPVRLGPLWNSEPTDGPVPDGDDSDPIDGADAEQVPLSILLDVLRTYRRYEDEGREASWFHANRILQRKLDAEIDLDVAELLDADSA